MENFYPEILYRPSTVKYKMQIKLPIYTTCTIYISRKIIVRNEYLVQNILEIIFNKLSLPFECFSFKQIGPDIKKPDRQIKK
jgi:hypothetical protein